LKTHSIQLMRKYIYVRLVTLYYFNYHSVSFRIQLTVDPQGKTPSHE